MARCFDARSIVEERRVVALPRQKPLVAKRRRCANGFVAMGDCRIFVKSVDFRLEKVCKQWSCYNREEDNENSIGRCGEVTISEMMSIVSVHTWFSAPALSFDCICIKCGRRTVVISPRKRKISFGTSVNSRHII